MDLINHPCFNAKVRGKFGRVHLPVAPRCNIQCNYCDRKYDCVNESRPGVTSAVLTPHQAMAYLEFVFEKTKNISVVGIAGPGDPFANPKETMQTLRLVREKYPEMMLCLATNGLGIEPYIDELAQIGVSHVTITLNAVDPEIGAKIYSFIRYGKKTLAPKTGIKILLEKQLEAIASLKEKGITTKVNTIILPGINEDHIEEVAKKMGGLKVDILNCIPFYPNKGSS
ncbi:MAG: radical SAM protein, partial [Deltaproteobacteria bacterium]|nr:radical SAM protein [Deltaproteobacteria bacterium]